MRYYRHTTGFSLVETLVSISILLLIIVGPMTISSRAAKSTTFASEQVTAFFLAQEGAELAQKLRDDFVLEYSSSGNPNPWTDFRGVSNCYSATGCGLSISEDGQSVNVRSCSVSGCGMVVSPGSSRAKYEYTSGTTGVTFTRTIRFTVISADQVLVESDVAWRTGSLRDEQRATVETVLFNIYGAP